MPGRAVALLAPSELLLRVAGVGGLLRLRLAVTLGLGHPRLPAARAPLPVARHRDPDDRGAGRAVTWQRASIAGRSFWRRLDTHVAQRPSGRRHVRPRECPLLGVARGLDLRRALPPRVDGAAARRAQRGTREPALQREDAGGAAERAREPRRPPRGAIRARGPLRGAPAHRLLARGPARRDVRRRPRPVRADGGGPRPRRRGARPEPRRARQPGDGRRRVRARHAADGRSHGRVRRPALAGAGGGAGARARLRADGQVQRDPAPAHAAAGRPCSPVLRAASGPAGWSAA